MQAGSLVRAGFLGMCALALAGCEEGGFGQQGFRAQYAVARDALETGNYARANRHYQKLIGAGGPLQPRLRLEYAHSLLRGGDHAQAAEQARYLARRQTGAARGAALAVQGTAEHEMGRAALAAGDRAGGRRHLAAAQAALAEVLDRHPEMDPLGALAGRQASIEVRLKGLG